MAEVSELGDGTGREEGVISEQKTLGAAGVGTDA